MIVRQEVVLLALAAFCDGALTGCAPRLPRLVPSVNPALGQAPLRSITVLPIDLTLDADEPPGVPSADASYRASLTAVPAITLFAARALERRGWAEESLAWDGTLTDGRGRRAVLDPQGMANLADWLLAYTYDALSGQVSAAYDLAIPPLPFATDATLFVGGYGHLFRDRPHRVQVGINVAIGIGVTLLVVGILVLLVMSKGKSGFPIFGVAPLDPLTFPIAVGLTLALTAPRAVVAVNLPPGHVHTAECNEYLGIHGGVVYYSGRPRPVLTEAQRRHNILAVGATLVDNRTGRILWTAAQPMPIDPVDQPEIEQAIDHLLRDLPTPRP